MRTLVHLAHEEKQSSHTGKILILDKQGIIAAQLYQQIRAFSDIVIVSDKKGEQTKNALFLPYGFIPKIPEQIYRSTFFIWDGEKSTLENIDPCINKSIRDHGQFFFIGLQEDITQEIVSRISGAYRNAYTIVIGDIFEKGETYEYTSALNAMLDGAVHEKRILLEQTGQHLRRPILLDDVISGVLQVAFGTNLSSRVYFLFPKHEFTELTLAHALQKIEPLIKIDFSIHQREKEQKSPFVLEGEHVFGVNYPVLTKFQHTYIECDRIKEKKTEDQVPVLYTRSHGVSKSDKSAPRVIKFLLIFIGTLVLLPVILAFVFVLFGASHIMRAQGDIDSGRLEQAAQDARQAKQLFALARQYGMPLKRIESGIGAMDGQYSFTRITANGETLASTMQTALEGGSMLLHGLQGTTNNSKQAFVDGINAVASAYTSMQDLEGSGDLPGFVNQKVKQFVTLLALFANTSKVLPDVFGVNGERTYLVLFQNNMELRPGGGFIGSYGIISFKNGAMGALTIHDVYDADGQLKGHVEPPFAVRRYLPSSHWYLRDSNFDADFVKDGYDASNLYNLEMGQRVNGVVGIDLSFVKNILQATGPVYIPEYNQTVSADNFFSLAETHAEKNFFPGSSQKKDFLKTVFTQVQNVLETGRVSYLALLKAGIESMQQKHMLFAFADPSDQNVFTVNGLSSSLWDGREIGPDRLNDFIGINEANLGVNKANYFVKRSISQQEKIDTSGNVISGITISYINDSKPNEWPGGVYKNYLRIIVPADVRLQSVAINGTNQIIVPAVTDFLQYEKQNFVPPSGLEVETTQEENKTLFGFLVSIPQQTTTTVSVVYQLAKPIDLQQSIMHYGLVLFKQPGTDMDQYSFSLTYPDAYKVFHVSQGVSSGNNTSSFFTNLATDQSIQIDLARK